MPVQGGKIGYERGGVIGSVGGVLGGVITGSFVAGGIMIGSAFSLLYRCSLGIIRTPMFIWGKSTGMHWDKDAEKWEDYDMETERQKFSSASEKAFIDHIKDGGTKKSFYTQAVATSDDTTGSKASPVPSKKNVLDREMYDVLGVEPEATSGEIKKAYYIKARENHPDRNPGDDNAKAKFQKIGQAYQILADQKLRDAYDTRGKPAVSSSHNMDAGFLYTIIFGNDQFDAIIGELSIATSMKLMMETNMPPEVLRLRQRKRELDCAITLADKLDSYVIGDEAEFVRKVEEEATSLAECQLGATLLGIIGNVYIEQARCSTSTVDSMWISVLHIGSSISNSFSKLSFGIKSIFSAVEVSNLQSSAQKKKDDAELQQIETLPPEEKERRLQERKDKEISSSSEKHSSMGIDSMLGPNPTEEEKQEAQSKIKRLTGNM